MATIADEISIIMTWSEVEVFSWIGVQRNIMGLRDNYKPGGGIGFEDTWTKNIEGAGAEAAVAKWRNVYWSGTVGDTKADDVMAYQVRCNGSRRLDDMCLRPEDKKHKDKVFISVLAGFTPLPRFYRFTICGWILGRDGMQNEVPGENRPRWREGSPGRPFLWWVPRKALHPPSTLPEPRKPGIRRPLI
jgi:hypothetical protein